ncbi:T6SS amidase immunity protein Tai4 family protein [Enterobacter cloacae]|uniref:T6SS amidase immunity protein Tai4 family protein n=1 Tax=Enterobacter cloacae TaxID=550 RepID=UPI002FF624F0
MRAFFFLLICMTSYAYGVNNYPDFQHQQTYRQVMKDYVLARCLAEVADKGGQFSADAGLSASALLEWMPFDVENGMEKVETVIKKYKDEKNSFHSERSQKIKGVTLNCLRLYHSDELNKLVPQVIIGDPDRTWIQDNPQ